MVLLRVMKGLLLLRTKPGRTACPGSLEVLGREIPALALATTCASHQAPSSSTSTRPEGTCASGGCVHGACLFSTLQVFSWYSSAFDPSTSVCFWHFLLVLHQPPAFPENETITRLKQLRAVFGKDFVARHLRSVRWRGSCLLI